MTNTRKNQKNCKLPPANKCRFTSKIYRYSSPRVAQKMAHKYLGKSARLYPATNPHKKYRVCNPKTGKWTQFGQIGYEDFTKHKDRNRRKNYLTRTAKMRGDWKHSKYSANNLSRNVLW